MMKFNATTLLVAVTILSGCVSTGGLIGTPDYDSANRKPVSVEQTRRGVEVTVNEKVFFDSGQHALKGSAKNALDRIAEIIKERSDKDVLIEGHTDNVGDRGYNQRLSEQRAAAVKRALQQRGIAGGRMRTAGKGESRPVANNATPEGRQRNRRTEIVLLDETTANIGGAEIVDYLEGALGRLKQFGSSVMDAFK